MWTANIQSCSNTPNDTPLLLGLLEMRVGEEEKHLA